MNDTQLIHNFGEKMLALESIKDRFGRHFGNVVTMLETASLRSASCEMMRSVEEDLLDELEFLEENLILPAAAVAIFSEVEILVSKEFDFCSKNPDWTPAFEKKLLTALYEYGLLIDRLDPILDPMFEGGLKNEKNAISFFQYPLYTKAYYLGLVFKREVAAIEAIDYRRLSCQLKDEKGKVLSSLPFAEIKPFPNLDGRLLADQRGGFELHFNPDSTLSSNPPDRFILSPYYEGKIKPGKVVGGHFYSASVLHFNIIPGFFEKMEAQYSVDGLKRTIESSYTK